MNKNKSIIEIFEQYISPKIPRKITNVLWNLFRGVELSLGYLESYLKTSKREQNILTAQEVSSLRNLASKNGFEPQLKIPSKGKILLIPSGSLFAKNGTTVFLPAYAKLTEENSGLEYFVDNNNITKISNQPLLLSIKQGVLESKKELVSIDEKLYRFYLNSGDVADKSITIFDEETKEEYVLVESFYDNVNLNDNRQFMIKFSTKPTSPIVLYIKGTKLNQTLNISYILTQGSNGNIVGDNNFKFENLMDYKGNQISYNSDDLEIQNYDGFTLGSDGSDINTLKSAIGFNHGINMIFDAVSYRNFLNKFSTLLIQDIVVDGYNKSIKHLYIGKKNVIIGETEQTKSMYNKVTEQRLYLMNRIEEDELEFIIEENEFALSSSIIHNPKISKFAIQITFKTVNEMYKFGNKLELILYNEFAKFLYIEKHSLSVHDLVNNFAIKNNIDLEILILNDKRDLYDEKTPINSTEYIPLLQGDFNIYDENNMSFMLNENVIFVVEN